MTEKKPDSGKKKNSAKKNNKKEALIIVESPTKAKTIHKYLPKDYKVLASMGHIIDLPKSRLAVDVSNDFTPDYITVRGRAKILNELKKEASKANKVFLASDPDREGEAISYHLKNVLNNYNDNVMRIEFNEITQEAVQNAIATPRKINMNLFYAQQARRVLDRLVGYNISPLLWKKVKKGLSAGRVQSVALKLICEREDQIEKFESQEYWTIDADLSKGNKKVTASLAGFKGEKIAISTEEESSKIISELDGGKFIVREVKKSIKQRRALPPYTTSKLQQDAATRLGFNSAKTMMIAQQLYEGINLAGEGATGLITYMRTDSVRVSQGALERVRSFISDNYSKDYLPENGNFFSSKKNAQDAHEAIRPTDPYRVPSAIKDSLSKDQFKLYDLIWQKFVSSQMNPERYEQMTLYIYNGEYEFRASGKNVLFKGFTVLMEEIVANNEGKEKKDKIKKIPQFQEGDILDADSVNPEQHFTSPPPRYNDASIVKKLEESGVGRPSTYAPTISTLIKRYYITRSSRQLIPTQLGIIVNNILIKNFDEILELGFTAEMESKLDKIEEGNENWVSMIRDFYGDFMESVKEAETNIEEMKSILDEETDYVCEHCGKPMVKKLGKFGFFLACSGFPECRNAKPVPLGPCPKPTCDGNVIKRSTRKGRPFYGCSNYPDCDFSTWYTPLEDSKCQECGSILFEKSASRKKSEDKTVCLNPECKNFHED